MEILIILGLILLNGVFSMAEIALVSSRKFKLESAAKKGNRNAKTALDLSKEPTKFLSTIQIGITLIGILLGVFSGANMTNDFQLFLEKIEPLRPYSHSIAIGLVVLMITFLSILLGELLPKRIGLSFPETIAMLVSRPMKWLAALASPFVWLLSACNDILLKMLFIKPGMDSRITEEEIKSIIQESTEGGEIQEIEQDIVERVFDLGDRKANSLMTHRSDLVWFDLSDNMDTIRHKVKEEMHSAYPVCDRQIDDIRGIVLIKDLFTIDQKEPFQLEKHLRQPLYINENTPTYKLLEYFKKDRIHYAVIIDEYGSTKGMLTMDDLVDALIGDVSEYNQDEYNITQRDDQSWLADAQYSYFEFLRYFDIQHLKQEDHQFHTIGGLIIYLLGNIPKVGEKVSFGPLELEIVDMDKYRIDKVLITSKSENDEDN